MSLLVPAFNQFPEEAAIIGRLLSGYAELEFAFGLCVERTMRKPQEPDGKAAMEYWADNRHLGLKALYRLRSESSRLQVGDAIARSEFSRLGIEGCYAEAIGAMRHCLKIRNQYAHCHWSVITSRDKRGLFFTDLEDNAQGAGDFEFKFYHRNVNLTLLNDQSAFFDYTKRCLDYAHGEFRVAAKMARSHDADRPKTIPQPPLHNPEWEYGIW